MKKLHKEEIERSYWSNINFGTKKDNHHKFIIISET